MQNSRVGNLNDFFISTMIKNVISRKGRYELLTHLNNGDTTCFGLKHTKLSTFLTVQSRFNLHQKKRYADDILKYELEFHNRNVDQFLTSCQIDIEE